jgi:hypothetical protein
MSLDFSPNGLSIALRYGLFASYAAYGDGIKPTAS